MVISFQEVKDLIQAEMADAQVEITDLTGTGDHLGITVKSQAFKGKRLIQQHQMIMNILKHKISTEEIHAVQIKTLIAD